ncbi:MAG TPA: YcxB family protein [Thiolinea sp.]|nr:YcxB family protein [Thiolinea sp.]
MSTDAVKATYTISERDFLAASRLNETPSRRLILILVVILILLAAVYFTDYYGYGQLALGTFIGLSLGYLFLHFVGSPFKAKRFYRGFKALHDTFTVQLLPAGVEIGSSTGVNTLLWQDLKDWKQNQDYLLLYPKPEVFYILPKKISEQGFDGRALVQALERYVGKSS